jgi:hypothetical protein
MYSLNVTHKGRKYLTIIEHVFHCITHFSCQILSFIHHLDCTYIFLVHWVDIYFFQCCSITNLNIKVLKQTTIFMWSTIVSCTWINMFTCGFYTRTRFFFLEILGANIITSIYFPSMVAIERVDCILDINN